jgi:hypothetical protein
MNHYQMLANSNKIANTNKIAQVSMTIDGSVWVLLNLLSFKGTFLGHN